MNREPSPRADMSKVRYSLTPPMDTLISDVRFAIRSLVRSPSFALTAVLALGLGIGSTAGVFSLLEGVVLRPLPYREPEPPRDDLGHEP